MKLNQMEAVVKSIGLMSEPLLKSTLSKIVTQNDIVREQLFEGLVDSGVIYRNDGHFELAMVNKIDIDNGELK